MSQEMITGSCVDCSVSSGGPRMPGPVCPVWEAVSLGFGPNFP